MAYLVASLKDVFNELDTVWPKRDRRTDGWIGDKNHCPGTSAHCADSQGRVHAIDVDKDGIDTNLVIERLVQYRGVIRYINWNYYQFHVKNDYEPRKLGGKDPHTGHMHIEIEKTDTARNYRGGYGIVPGTLDLPAPVPELQTTPQSQWDHSPLVYDMAGSILSAGDNMSGFSSLISQLRI